MFFTISIVGLLLTVNAYFPIRKEPLSVLSFILGWIPSELPIQVLLGQAIVVVLMGLFGAFHGWQGTVGAVVTVASWVGLVGLTILAHRSGSIVKAALDEVIGSDSAVDSPALWNRGWRVAVGIPISVWGVKRIRNVDYVGDGRYRHKLDVLVPKVRSAEPAPVMVYIHGGAWIMGNKTQQGIPMMSELVQRGWVCIAINYGLSPKVRWPAHVVDCKRALAWVKEHVAEYGGDPNFVVLSGGSAGGHLSSLLAVTANDPVWQPGFEDVDTSVAACVPFYGVYDMTGGPEGSGKFGPGFLKFLERRVMSETSEINPGIYEQASPTHRVTADVPPMLVLHGTNDTLVPVEVGRAFVSQLRSMSSAPVVYVELPRAQHAFDVMTSIRSRHTTHGVVRFLEHIRTHVTR